MYALCLSTYHINLYIFLLFFCYLGEFVIKNNIVLIIIENFDKL